MSCDKNNDLWEPFHHCMEKYWPNHPEVVFSTETLVNPFYRTICKNVPFEKYSLRVYETVKELEDDYIIMMCDDLFFRKPVNVELIEKMKEMVVDDVAAFNFEPSFDYLDIPINDWVAIRSMKGAYKTSIMCQLWAKDKLLKVFEGLELDPWKFEILNDFRGFTYLILRNYDAVDWGRKFMGDKWGIYRGKWCKECKAFLDKEGLQIDYSKRGFYD